MLRDIYDSTSTAIDSSLDSATALCATVDKTVQIGLSDISKASEETHTSSGNHRDQADKAQSAACKSWMHQLDGVLASRLSAVEKTLEVSRKVPANKEELEQTVGKLVKDVDQAIEEGCAAVDRTSEMANKILTDVHSASTKMNNSASKSMDTFVMFMDKEGEAISVGLSTHFDSLKDHLQSQTEGLNEMRVQTVTHGKTVEESVVIPSGGTPPKTEYRKRAVLANTRSHEAIKDEVRRRNNQRIAEE